MQVCSANSLRGILKFSEILGSITYISICVFFFFGNFPGVQPPLFFRISFYSFYLISFYFTLFCWPSCIIFILLLPVQCTL